MYSLWRADVMLGLITPELSNDSPVAIVVGIFQPTDEFSPDLAVMQRTMDTLPGAPVWQWPHPMPRGESSSESGSNSESVGLKFLSEVERRGVPADEQLQLRDQLGHAIPTSSISVMEMRLGNRTGVDALCAAAGVTFSGWYMTATIGRAV